MANYPGGGGGPSGRSAGPDQQDRQAKRESKPGFKKAQKKNYRAILDDMSVKDRQKWLRRMGYRVAVDGKLGPQTRGATRAFLNKVPASNWNKKKPTATGPSARLTHERALGDGHDHSGGGGGGKPAALPRLGGGGPMSMLGTDTGLINPAEYAKSLVAMEFDPAIGAMTRDIRQQRAQGQQNISDITGWFDQLEKVRAGSQASSQAGGQAAIADLERMQAGARASFGGDQGAAAAYQGIGLAGLKGIEQSQNNFMTNMQAILAAQGNDARTNQQRSQDMTMRDMTAKRSDMFKAKGSAYSKALQDAVQLRSQQRGQNIQQMSAMQAMQMAREMAPYELANARLGLQNTKEDQALQRMQMQMQAQGFQQNQRESALDFQIKQAQFQDFMASLGDEGRVRFADLTPKDRLGMSESIRSMAAGSPGNVAAMRVINTQLRAAGFDPKNPAVRVFANGILTSLPGYRPNRGKKKKK
jgi:hypothetical protein